ncbi:TetR family transcriptional regulator [Plantibacter sp. CFBP 8775]|uniref:TetR family transcriptional regulator n=1 Tax=Plantibacter sp. CFBP 8775 TaxID=2774038 RepID=UPI00177B4AFF|nr:TetR/AcrR family transcriptional regulator [Plantibacter sp. CFBP 8775]
MTAVEPSIGSSSAEAILQAAADLLREHPFDDIGYGQLGAQAGVSERTVFRQFPTREHLLERLAAWISQHGFEPPRFHSIAGLRAAVRSAFRAYDEAPGQAALLARAETMAPVGAQDARNGTTALATELDRLFLRVAPGLSSVDRRRGVASLLLAAGPTHWARMRSAFDFDGASSAAVFDAVLDTTLASLRLGATVVDADGGVVPGTTSTVELTMSDAVPEPMDPLGDRHDERNPRTTELILTTFIELIEELGSDDVSYKLIARRSGLGERTIARYFPTRFDLVTSLARHLADEVFAPSHSSSVFELPIVIRESMLRFGERHELAHLAAEASTRTSHGGLPAQARRIASLVDAEAVGLESGVRAVVIARLTHLDSPAAWATLARWHGRDVSAIADAAAWALESALDPLRDNALHQARRAIGTETGVTGRSAPPPQPERGR